MLVDMAIEVDSVEGGGMRRVGVVEATPTPDDEVRDGTDMDVGGERCDSDVRDCELAEELGNLHGLETGLVTTGSFIESSTAAAAAMATALASRSLSSRSLTGFM